MPGTSESAGGLERQRDLERFLTFVDAVVAIATVRNPELTDGLGTPDPVEAWVSVGLLLTALAVSILVPAIGYSALLRLLLDEPVSRLVRRRQSSE